jgi:RecA/RadA recombinase
MGRKKKSLGGDGTATVDVTAPFGEHPLMTEILKATAEEQDPLIGLPLPALSARYLLQSTIFPLSRFTQLRGKYSSGKSALLIEIMRWFTIYGGGGVMIDTENKGSRSMIDGLLGHNVEHMKRAVVVGAETVEEWQKRYISLCQLIHKQADAGSGVYPMCIGVDSISAVEVERRVDKVAEEGHASSGHPYLARNLSDFMRTALVPTLRHYPIAFVATNHLKEEINSTGFGPPKKYAPGGASLDYYPTIIIDMERVSSKMIERNGQEGQQVRLIATKNNLGAPGRRILVNLLWYPKTIAYNDPESNETRYMAQQHHFWDWHTATTRLLMDLQDPDRKPQPGHDPKLGEILKQVCDLEYKHGTKNADVPLVFSDALGISKQDAVPEVEISLMIEENKKISGLLHGLLGINEYAVCDPAVKYREQVMEELRKNHQTDNPELMAATGALEDLLPADLDPLGQFAE